MSSWLIDAADLLAQPDPGPTPWLVEGLMGDEALIAAVGRWKTTKSYAIKDISIAIATGRAAFGCLAIPNPGPVMFINEESGRAALWRRLDALCRGRKVDPEELRGRLHVAANARVRLDDLGWQQELVDTAKELRPRLIVFDPLARMKAPSREENSQKDMAVLVEFIRNLRDESRSAVCFVHHTGHAGGNMRGSSDLESVWETRLTWARDGQSPLVTLTSEHREAEAGQPVQYRIAWDSDNRSMRFDVTDDNPTKTTQELVREYLADNPKSKAREISKGIAIRATDVERTLDELQAAGKVDHSRSGRTDKLGREIRDKVYSLASGSSQISLSDTPRTTHGTNHNRTSHLETDQDEPHLHSQQPSGLVARPADGTNQDEPRTEHRGPSVRPASIEADGGTSHTDDPCEDWLEQLARIQEALELERREAFR